MHEVFLGLGSNMGERESVLYRACTEIERLIGPVTGRSAFLETEPWGFQSDQKFLNAVVRCSTTLGPLSLLDATQKIERLLGKRSEHATIRPTARAASGQTTVFKDRPIDIDILLYDCSQIHEPRLTVPHPLMLQRDFVMTPLLQVLCRQGDHRYLEWLRACR